MKAKIFENLIRKIVREEIDYALRREIKSLKEDLREDVKPVINEQPLSNESKESLREKIMGTTKIKNNVSRNFTSNQALNDLLNETAQGDTNLDNGASPVSMEGDFSTIGGIPAETAPQAVVEAVNRDYSGLMKAIEKKKNHRP